MMKMFMFLSMIMLLPAGVALSQIDPGPDGIGIYLDAAATQNSLFCDAGTVVSVHVMITNPTATTAIYGWGVGIRVQGDLFYFTTHLPPGSALVNPYPELVVACNPGTVMPEPILDLATIDFIPLTAGVAEFFLTATQHGEPPFYAFAPDADYRGLNPSSGSLDLPVFRVNGLGPVSELEASWGSVKALFR